MTDTDINHLIERLWTGEAAMEEWTAAVAGGAINAISDDMIVVSTSYLFGNVTAIRTDDWCWWIPAAGRVRNRHSTPSAGGMTAVSTR
jgi:hypothetical protein